MAKLLLDRYLADILRLAEELQKAEDQVQDSPLRADPLWRYATLHRIGSIVGRALQEAEFELEQAEREQSG